MSMEIESHPFEPFLPPSARLLMLGTFPPSPRRWCMDWYYPNYTNDMWRIFGLHFFGDKMHFVDAENKTFRLALLRQFLAERGVAIYDTAVRIRRTKGTASDKDLEVVQPANLDALLEALPACQAVLTAGQLATHIFSHHFGITSQPVMGEWVPFVFKSRPMRLYRQPSSSRAYPMKVENKAQYYARMFDEILK